jgi:DNA-entry nuclease
MPTEEREAIGQVKPTGWVTAKYDFVDGKYLYNRCHLIGFQLTGENARAENLITGTRYMNVDGMLPFENMVADYVTETGNHVIYRVTPMFDGDNLLATGVLMEAKSVEDNGDGILFCVFVYNVQPGVEIDYKTGDSRLKEQPTTEKQTTTKQEVTTKEETTTVTSNSSYPVIGNKNTKAYHRTSCKRLPKEKNRVYFDSEEEANEAGYDNPCDYCDP